MSGILSRVFQQWRGGFSPYSLVREMAEVSPTEALAYFQTQCDILRKIAVICETDTSDPLLFTAAAFIIPGREDSAHVLFIRYMFGSPSRFIYYVSMDKNCIVRVAADYTDSQYESTVDDWLKD